MAKARFKVVKIPYDDRYDVVITTPPYKGQRQGKSFRTKAEAREWGSRAVRSNPRNPRKRATSRRKKNPVRVAASMAGKSTGWMPAKAVRVVRGKGGKVRVDVKR